MCSILFVVLPSLLPSEIGSDSLIFPLPAPALPRVFDSVLFVVAGDEAMWNLGAT